MQFEFIYTFEEKEQDIIRKEVPNNYLKHKESFSEYITRGLSDGERAELVKISCCAFDVTTGDLPEWYLECNGKLFFN